MILKDLTLDTPEANILLDEVLYMCAEKFEAQEYLRFWESQTTFIVLGRIGKEHEDVCASEAIADHIPVLRRTSGGGTVVQGKGCLNYTVVLNKSRDRQLQDLRLSYQWISQRVIHVLALQGIRAEFRPISDMALADNDRKFSGNAQRRGKNFILHHGTILYDFDLTLISRYLCMPKDIPDYRRSRGHQDFVCNIPVDVRRFKSDLSEQLGVSQVVNQLTAQEQNLLLTQQETFPVRVDLQP